MAVAVPAYYTLKANLKTLLEEVATAEALVSAGRNFRVAVDMARPWVEKEHSTALVVVSLGSVEGRGNKGYKSHDVTVNLDMYVLGLAEEQTDPETGAVTVLPSCETAAARLDLLTAQVEYAISRLKNYNLGFAEGEIARDQNTTLTYWSQENEMVTGQYAPARLSFNVHLSYTPVDDGPTVALSELNLTMKQALEDWAVKYTYGTE